MPPEKTTTLKPICRILPQLMLHGCLWRQRCPPFRQRSDHTPDERCEAADPRSAPHTAILPRSAGNRNE